MGDNLFVKCPLKPSTEGTAVSSAERESYMWGILSDKK